MLKGDVTIDGGEKGCGELLMEMAKAVRPMEVGLVLEVYTYDAGAAEDIPAWCRLRGFELLGTLPGEGRQVRYFIRKTQ